MDEGGETPDGRRESLARLIARLHGARAGVSDAEARAEQLAARQRQLHEFLVQRCNERGVPRAADVRRWALAREPGDAVAFAEVSKYLTARGAPEDARWMFVVLAGPPGTAKTSALARAVARHPIDALFVLAPDAARALQGGPRSFERDRAALALTERMRAVDLLCVDELGTEPEDLSSELTALVAARCSDGLATIFAANLTADAFRARYASDRWKSRLTSSGGALINVQGPDLRRDP